MKMERLLFLKTETFPKNYQARILSAEIINFLSQKVLL
jgi:hypothetical protein